MRTRYTASLPHPLLSTEISRVSLPSSPRAEWTMRFSHSGQSGLAVARGGTASLSQTTPPLFSSPRLIGAESTPSSSRICNFERLTRSSGLTLQSRLRSSKLSCWSVWKLCHLTGSAPRLFFDSVRGTEALSGCLLAISSYSECVERHTRFWMVPNPLRQ